jgi:hypothetical protein
MRSRRIKTATVMAGRGVGLACTVTDWQRTSFRGVCWFRGIGLGDQGGGLGDQGGGAFGSAAVPRPMGSSLMPLRRTSHHPDLARWLVSRAKTHRLAGIPSLLILCCCTQFWCANPSPAAGADGVSRRGQGRSPQGGGTRAAVRRRPLQLATKAPSPNAQITSVPVPANYPKPDPPRS